MKTKLDLKQPRNNIKKNTIKRQEDFFAVAYLAVNAENKKRRWVGMVHSGIQVGEAKNRC
jgi:hypothetical protein